MTEDVKSDAFRLKCALLCEDVRKEVSGKEILIGVLADAIYVTFIPFPFVVTLYIRAMFSERESYLFEFRVLGPSDVPVTPVVTATVGKPADIERSVSLVLNGIMFQVQSYGLYKFQWKPPDQDWETMTTLHIARGENPPSGLVPPISASVSENQPS